jgi:hypothetical protein
VKKTLPGRANGSAGDRLRAGVWLLTSLCIAALLFGCSSGSAPGGSVEKALYGENAGVEPLQLKGDLLTIENRSGQDWSSVQVTLNTFYRVATSSIANGGKAQARLDSFVDNYNRKFDPGRTSTRNFHLTAKLPDGKTYEARRQYQ